MKKKYSISELAKQIDAKVIGDDQLLISGVAPLDQAGQSDLTFYLGGRYRTLLPKTKAAAVVLTDADIGVCPAVSLVVDSPETAFAKIASLFDSFEKPKPGIHPSAIIAPTANVPASASVGACTVIGEHVSIGENTIIGNGVSINNHAAVGQNCLIHDNVVLYHNVKLGNGVILHSGAIIGADGFGYTNTKTGWQKIPQIGSVHLHDNVEIGANTCIDRGALVDTVIYEGVKIDNLVQIAHNVEIGAHTIIAGCSAIAGSTKVGSRCVIAGAVNIAGHLTICDGVIFTGNAMVTGSIVKPGVYSSGTGLMESAKWRKMAVRLRQIDAWMRRNK